MVGLSQIVKRIVTMGLILGSAGYYANGRLRLMASYAVVAAPAISIRAPGDGILWHSIRTFSLVQAGSHLADVKVASVNDAEIRAATTELTTVRADVESLKGLILMEQETRTKTLDRQFQLGVKRTEQLQRLVKKADSDLAAKKAAMEGAEAARKRSAILCSQGLMGMQDCETLQTKAEIDKGAFEAAQAQFGIARFMLESTRAGVDVGQDVGSEVTYARQQRDDLTLRLASLKQQLETQEARARALELRVAPPPITITVSSKSRVWSVTHQSGTPVVKGDPLFELVDCEQLFVFATISEDRYEKLRIGMRANVKFNGTTYPGTIAQLLGPYGTFAQDRGMQPQPPVIVNGRDASSAAVAVQVPGIVSALGRACEIGTPAEVEFTK